MQQSKTIGVDMNLYRWRSHALKQYGLGYIIVMAKDVDGARKGALIQYEHQLKQGGLYYDCLADSNGDFIDEDARIEFIEKMAVFKSDIEVQPDVIDTGILFIDGSE